MLKILFQLTTDPFYILKGKILKNKKSTEYKFAFIVHSRNYSDIYRKFPIFRILPEEVGAFIMRHLWPITLSKVTGVQSIDKTHEITGYVLGITMTADQMLKDRPAALKKIRNATYLAKGKGARILGLGGLTSSLSKGGLDLLDISINITTGHAYTAFNVYQNLTKIVQISKLPVDSIKIAIVGAAGSIGSMTSLLIARAGYKNIIIIDTNRKQENLDKLFKEIKQIAPRINLTVSDNINSIKECDFIVTATNTAEALITPDLVSDGMVLIDDAQPSDIHPDVLKMGNVLVVEAGVVHTPGIHSNFNYGLKSKTDNFCCMAELLILASLKWDSHYVINRATLEKIDDISEKGSQLGFTTAAFQNFLESVTHDKIETVMNLARQKHGV